MFGRFDEARHDLRSLSLDQLCLRLIVLIAPLVCTSATFAASSNWIPWLLLFVFIGAIECATHTDSNLGFGLIIVQALHWIATVDDRRTPWLLVAALAIAAFHTAMAASGVSAPAARWSRPMRSRWARRLALVAMITVAAWAVELSLTTTDLAGSALVLAASLVMLTLAALALRARSLSSSG